MNSHASTSKSKLNALSADTSSTVDLRIDWCSHDAAKFAVEHWHYSKTLPAPPFVRVGAWENGKFIGVILFSRGASQNLCRPYCLRIIDVCELTRVALTKHANPVTRIVAIAIRFLKKQSPELKLCISFADPAQGHIGGIYQGGNWVYAGETAPSRGYMSADGKMHHERTISPTGRTKQFGIYKKVLKPSECTVIRLPGKHRYLMPLDDATKAAIEKFRKPYPKREKQATGGYHPSSGGAAPTLSLHTTRSDIGKRSGYTPTRTTGNSGRNSG